MGSKTIPFVVSPYLSFLLHPPKLKQIVNKSAKQIKDIEFDSVAFRGMSGALLAPLLAIKLDKNLLMVRKNLNITHSSYPVEGFNRSKKYIIVDDFIESGKTIGQIYCAIKKFSPKSKCVGILCCSDGSSRNNAVFLSVEEAKSLFPTLKRMLNK